MGRHKLWFPVEGDPDVHVHRTSEYRLVRVEEDGARFWTLQFSDRTEADDEYLYSWSARQKNPPFTAANAFLKTLQDSDTTDSSGDAGNNAPTETSHERIPINSSPEPITKEIGGDMWAAADSERSQEMREEE